MKFTKIEAFSSYILNQLLYIFLKQVYKFKFDKIVNFNIWQKSNSKFKSKKIPSLLIFGRVIQFADDINVPVIIQNYLCKSK